MVLPVLLVNWYSVYIDTFFEPPFMVRKLDIIPAHLSLSHAAILRKGPVFESVGSPPLA